MTSHSTNQKAQDIQKRLAALSPEKRAILEKKLKQQNEQAPTKCRKIPKASNRYSGPLSFSQQRIWFLKQLDPNSYAYNIPRAWEIIGDLNIAALEQALTTIVERHGSLRTVFSEVDGKPLQVINRPTAFSLAVAETDAWSTDSGDQAIQNYIETYARQPFNLSSDLMLRGTILRRSERAHILVLVLHHMAFDGWSMGVFRRELSQLYDSLSQGKSPSLPPLQLQYLDFAHWQREQLADDTLQRQVEYWKNELCGTPALLNLPTDRPRPTIQTFVGDKTGFQISPSLTTGIRRFSQESGATPFMVLLSALSVLLSRYSGQEDVMVGSPIANRNQAETEPLIGFFVNTLVLRNRLQGNPTFAELVARVKKSTLGAYAHKDVPFEELAAALQPERDPSHSLWFQVLFTLHNTPTKPLEFADLEVSSIELNNQRAKFDLTISLTETPSSLEGILSYNTDLFSRGTIERMLGHWQRLLGAAIANPQRCILELPLLTPSERQQLLEAWPQDTYRPLPQGALIHQQFEAQAATTPNAVAVTATTRLPSHLTYAELNDRANQLAHYLQSLGIEPDSLVGISVERSPEMVVAMLGVLKAGGAYVPLDPHYPTDRLAYMMADAKISVLLTQSQWLGTLPEHSGQSVCLDRDWSTIAKHPKQAPQSRVTPEHLAYVIYTSGSTGKPKGVMVQHDSLVNFTASARRDYEITHSDRVLQFASISFDAAAEEIYPCLTAGATLVLRSEEMLSSVPHFLQTCHAHGLTVLDLPTAYWQQIVIEMASQDITLPDTLKLVIIGGERVSPEHVKTWQHKVGNSPRLVNTYGPTEGTVVATAFDIAADAEIVGEVPIGKGIGNVETYVVDSQMQPVPIGVPGELLIGGRCLARGYLNRPELTRERFIANPFSPDERQRLYRTGDLVSYLASGEIEYLGRIDDQVKIRGFRVELGEVESALVSHEQVRDAVVVARADESGSQSLVAYLVSATDSLDVSAVRQSLTGQLPGYMVPSAFVRLDQLPLTPSGKVDRRALPEPDPSQRLSSSAFVAPRTPVEEILAEIWGSLLKLKQVGIHDSFFELGGHSLLATQMVSRVRQTLQKELPLRALFESPTIAELAAQLEDAAQQDQSFEISAVERSGPLPLSFSQRRLWFLDQLEGPSAAYNISQVKRLQGNLDLGAFRRALAELMERQEVLRTSLVNGNGEAVVSIEMQPEVPLTVIDLRGQTDAEQQAAILALEAVRRPFTLSERPLFRVTLLQTEADQAVMAVAIHHIISDAWSIGILWRELSALYQAHVTGVPAELPPLPVQYADYAAWQRQWLSGERLAQQLTFWKQHLSGAPALLDLPTDRPRPAVQTFAGSSKTLTLSPALTASLKQLSQSQGVTLFMVLLSAFQLLLSRYSGQDDVVVGTPIANRQRSEVEPLIGFFVNTLAMRTQLGEGMTYEQLLHQVRQSTLEAYAHQDLPFEKLVEELQPERSMSYSPLFQVMFILQNAPGEGLKMSGLSLSSVKRGSDTAKFDITLSMSETSQGLRGSFNYNTDLFDPDTIERMMGHFEQLLGQVATQPQQRIDAIDLLSSRERQQIVQEWNQTEVSYSDDKCIHQLFEQQVSKTPDAVALVFEDHQLTYAQLNEQANQLAHYLQKRGIGPNALVGLGVERSVDLLVGLLGILKAGAAYVPLDPAFPKERLAYMLKDAEVSVLITQSNLVDLLPAPATAVVSLNAEASVIEQESRENLALEISPNQLAYIIYTSGSTGNPKGVEIRHQGVVNFLETMAQSPGLTAQDRLLAVTTLSFDIAALELYLPLTVGAQLVMASREVATDGRKLSQLIEQANITTIQATPATWQMLLASGWQGAQLKVLCGGEALNATLAANLLEHNQSLWNLYGPTEATIWATVHRVQHSGERGQTPEAIEAIGHPIANTQAYILSPHMQPVPISVAGELHIGGVQLARGYRNRPELTAEKFVANPFGEGELYKTGDLARYRADGAIEFLGRIDHQVKIRGFRVELGEIETALSQHRVIQHCVVIAREDMPGGKHLVAYWVSDTDEAPSQAELRQFLQQILPDYMVPSIFMRLEALPLTPNKKVNRRALPKPDINQLAMENAFTAPRTPVEEKLAQVWCDVLRLEQVSIHDSFFELGGHSLLAAQVIARIRSVFEVEIPLRYLFEAPRISELASLVEFLQMSLQMRQEGYSGRDDGDRETIEFDSDFL